jgi:hypothetical protein
MTVRGAGLFGSAPPEPVSLPPGEWCRMCGRPEVFDGGELCADCSWIDGDKVIDGGELIGWWRWW